MRSMTPYVDATLSGTFRPAALRRALSVLASAQQAQLRAVPIINPGIS